MKNYIPVIETALGRYLPAGEYEEQQLIDAVRYSLDLKGKRVRPSLTLAFAELCGGTVDMALPFACAVEMIHTYSLIHDDLPCMDNDDFRRGKPSNHKVFGEDIALLAGDALQSIAYETMLSDEAVAAVGGKRAAKAARILANRSGLLGMVGGQVIDLSLEHREVGAEIVQLMEEKKTSLFDGVNQECVFSKIVDYENEEFAAQDEEEKAYYTDYLKEVKDRDLLVYIIEYTGDDEVRREIAEFCMEENCVFYACDTLELGIEDGDTHENRDKTGDGNVEASGGQG